MKNKKLIAILVILPLMGFAGWWIFKPAKNIYKEFTVVRGDLENRILSTGTVQPENRLEIKAPIAGRINEILVEEGRKVKKGQVIAWMSSTERAALLDAARARGPEELKRWEELYKPTPIMAPLPGTIILRNVEPGQTITATDVTFALSDRLTVKAQVDETDIAKIKLHQKAEIILDAYPNNKINASVDQIAFEAKTVNNVTTYVVDVLPETAPPFMRAGMTANVRFQQDSRENILLLPSTAIFLTEGKTKILWRKSKSSIPEEKEIETGLSDGKQTEILSGLNENDVVVRLDNSKNEKSSANNPFSPFSNRRPGGPSGGGGRK